MFSTFSIKNIYQKYICGGHPKHRTWPKSKKSSEELYHKHQFVSSSHFAIRHDKIKLKVDSEDQEMYLAPCKKSKP